MSDITYVLLNIYTLELVVKCQALIPLKGWVFFLSSTMCSSLFFFTVSLWTDFFSMWFCSWTWFHSFLAAGAWSCFPAHWRSQVSGAPAPGRLAITSVICSYIPLYSVLLYLCTLYLYTAVLCTSIPLYSVPIYLCTLYLYTSVLYTSGLQSDLLNVSTITTSGCVKYSWLA